MVSRPAAGGGRHVDVSPERLERWLAGFAERHGDVTFSASPPTVTLTASDGAVASCNVPFPPLSINASLPYGGLIAHAQQERRVGVLLVRLGGYAVGIFDGTTLLTSKVGSRQVHGRSAAGGWSQQRFARRREGQVRVALQEAADVAARILAEAQQLDGVVLGGDKQAVGAVLDDARLAHLRPLVQSRLLDVPDPKLTVLAQTPTLFRAVRIHVLDP